MRAVLVGACLLTVRRFFGEEIPTVAAYAARAGLSPDTISRAASFLRRPVLGLLRQRRPGPRRQAPGESRGLPAGRQGASLAMTCCLALNSLLRAVLPDSLPRLVASCPKRRGLVVQQALHWQGQGVALEQVAQWLDLEVRTLRRWIKRCQERGNGQEVPHNSRRPHTSPGQVPLEIQRALFRLQRAMPNDVPASELARVFNQRYQELLKKHGWTSISERTARRYLKAPTMPGDREAEARFGSQRGQYRYPPVLTMAWVDTTQLVVAGTKVHIVASMEAASRIALSSDVFVEENTDATAQILALSIARVPDMAALVRDRGKPYLNERINDLLGECGVLAINAHPYFPIDKAALERFFGTMKAWLCHAVAPFEETCRKQERSPSAHEVTELVRPALRVFLRAYNLLPQPYLEGTSPIERIAALLRGEGDPGFTLSDLRQRAFERDTKDDLLLHIRDALQLRMSLKRLRGYFSRVSKTALQRAVADCAKKLIYDRDPRIYAPCAYLRSVAERKEQAWQEELARDKREREETTRRSQEDARREETIRQEEQMRREQPELVLGTDLAFWVESFARPFGFPRTATHKLATTLRSLKDKLGDAYSAQVAATQALLPGLLPRLRPNDTHLADKLVAAFGRLALNPLHPGDTTAPDPTPQPRKGGGHRPPDPPFSTRLRDWVLKPLGVSPSPHDGRTDVLS